MNSPTHEEVAQRAEKIWQDYGCPSGRDTEIWLEAEKQLTASDMESHENASILGEGHSDHALAEKASLKRKEAMAPKRPTKTALKSEPAETGKPLWDKPHSR